MLLLGFKNRMIGYLMLYISMGFIPLAFSGELIRPFLLTPGAEVEKYNYAAGIVNSVQPGLLLYVLYACLGYFSTVNLDSTVNDWIKTSIQDVGRVVLALLIYQVKELADYLIFENVVPDCFSAFWFLIFWELCPIGIILAGALAASKSDKK